MTLQEMIAKRNELDAQINAMSGKRQEAIRSILDVMARFVITPEELAQAQAQDDAPKPGTTKKTLTPISVKGPTRKTTTKRAAKKTAKKSASSRAKASTESQPAPSDATAEATNELDQSSSTPETNQSAGANTTPSTAAPREYDYGGQPLAAGNDDDDPNPIPPPLSDEDLKLLQGSGDS